VCASSIAFAKARSRGLSRSVRHTRPKADSGNPLIGTNVMSERWLYAAVAAQRMRPT
jgi:hypothetical protein